MAADTVTHHRWAEMPEQEVAQGIHRRYLTGSRVTVARFALARGAVVPPHKHEQEQVSCVLSGALRFRAGGAETVVRAGEVLEIPSWVEHGVEVIEDAVVIDVFSPLRQDWLDGTDTYFKK